MHHTDVFILSHFCSCLVSMSVKAARLREKIRNMRRVSMRPPGRILEASDKDGLKDVEQRRKNKEAEEQNRGGKKRGAYNFLQSSKWGPFWQRAVEKTAEWCDSGVEGWRRQEEGRGRAEDEEAGESEEEGEEKKG